MPSRRRRWGPRSLTARLVTGVVTLVAVLVLATGAGTFLALRSFLLGRLDQQLSAAALQNADYFDRCLDRLAVRGGSQCPPEGLPPTQREWVALLPPAGTPALVVSGSMVTSLTLSEAQRNDFLTAPGRLRTLWFAGTELRVAARNTSQGVVVVTGLSTTDVNRTLQRLFSLELIIGVSAVAIAFVATAGGVRFSLRKLRRVTVTARSVAAELSPEGAGLERRGAGDETGPPVGQLAESMNTLLAAVETQFGARLESEQRMRQFLADASHELRTPLTSIRGYAELARMQREQQGVVADPANLDRIESEGTRMSRLIDDLLLLARSDQGGVEDAPPVRELIDVDALLDDVVAGARVSFPARDIHLVAAPGLLLVGDPDQLVRAIRNLVTNAAVHTSAGGPIGVRAARDGDAVLIQVADSGPGLPPQEAAHVFERFWRADKARTRARGGSGLGMSIVASIVEAHGGTVRFDSSVETGSTVTVRLPGAGP